jgi:hypothetical protein
VGFQLTTRRSCRASPSTLKSPFTPDGMSMSYDTFKKAVASELDKERRLAQAKMYALEQSYQKLLAEAFADYQDVSGERDRLRSGNAFLSGRGVALRASWKFPVAVAAVALLCGVFVANAVAGGRPQTTRATARTAAVGAQQVLPKPAYVPVGCGQGTFVVQLEAISPADGYLDLRALVLQQELMNRIRNAHLGDAVFASQGRDYCVKKPAAVANDVFLWSGPFGTREEADGACQRFHAGAVSEDCYSVTLG